MTNSQTDSLKTYIRTLEEANISNRSQIKELQEQLNNQIQNNRRLVEQIQYLSCVNNRYEYESRIHDLQLIIQQRDNKIAKLLEKKEVQKFKYNRVRISQINCSDTSKSVRNQRKKEIKNEQTRENYKNQPNIIDGEKMKRILVEFQARHEQDKKQINLLQQKIQVQQNQILFLIQQGSVRIQRIEQQVQQRLFLEQRRQKSIQTDDKQTQTQDKYLLVFGNNLVEENKQLEIQLAINKKEINVLKNMIESLTMRNDNQYLIGLENDVSDLNIKVMHLQLKEKQWDRESLQLYSKIDQLNYKISYLEKEKQQNNIKKTGSIEQKIRQVIKINKQKNQNQEEQKRNLYQFKSSLLHMTSYTTRINHLKKHSAHLSETLTSKSETLNQQNTDEQDQIIDQHQKSLDISINHNSELHN